MGACTFSNFVSRNSKPHGFNIKMEGRAQIHTPAFTSWQSAREAFTHARERAQWEHGHGGYSWTIAEKGDFVMAGKAENLDEANKVARQLIDDEDPRIDDKWGPAGCIEVAGENGGWLFFGWASS